METDKLEEGGSKDDDLTNQLCVEPQQLFRFGSAIDVSSSYVDIRFSLDGEATFSSVWPQILACISAASFHLGAGAVLSFSAILIPQLELPDSEIPVTKEDISWIASVVPLMVPVGALVTGYLVDKIGRVHTIIAASVPFMIGWACIALAQNLPMLLFGRVLTGFSTAMGTSPAVVYITEIARADLRGALICLAPSLSSLGMVFIYTKGAFLNWRTVAWLSMAYCLLPVLFIILWSPESPVWLVSKDKENRAFKSLTYLLRKDKKEGAAVHQLAELVKEHNSKKGQANQKGSSFRRLIHGLTKATGLKPLILLTAIFGFQQFSGIYITIFYSVSFFKDVGAAVNPYVSSIGVGVVRLVLGLLTSILMGYFGRRPLYMVSGIGMAVFMFISGYITREEPDENMDTTIVSVVCVLLYMSLGVIGLLSIPWTMTAELFPIEIRGMAQGLIISMAHILMFTALKIYPFLPDLLGTMYAVQWMFSAVSLVAVIFIFIFLPETHKKQLEEIQEYFRNNTIYLLRNKKRVELAMPGESEEETTKLKSTNNPIIIIDSA